MSNDTQPTDSSMTKQDSLASHEARLNDLESRIAYQEHWLDSLDKALAEQHLRLGTLERLGELLRKRFQEQQQALTSHDDFHSQDETPPHY